MSIIRLVHMTYPAENADEAARNWKTNRGPLMAKQSTGNAPNPSNNRVLQQNQTQAGHFIFLGLAAPPDTFNGWAKSGDEHRLRIDACVG